MTTMQSAPNFAIGSPVVHREKGLRGVITGFGSFMGDGTRWVFVAWHEGRFNGEFHPRHLALASV